MSAATPRSYVAPSTATKPHLPKNYLRNQLSFFRTIRPGQDTTVNGVVAKFGEVLEEMKKS